ncbi:MAG: hypothetical protein P1V35_05405 [Planctomycetota bacterium]|nr:hypothetical protein [Planctomycetota bacterium]
MPEVMVLSSLEEYNFSGGVMVDVAGLASLHGAYFADAAIDESRAPAKFDGIGVSYWEADDPGVSPWGPYWIRWAAAQSFVEGIDPSWHAVGLYMVIHTKADTDFAAYGEHFWAEKLIPRWLRYGAASYVERFLPNPESQDESDLWKLRSFAFDELKQNGGLRELDSVFTFEASLADNEGTRRLYNEAGLIVSYLLDGSSSDTKLQKVLEAFRASIATGDAKSSATAAKKLESELKKRRAAILAYAGL